MHTMPFFSVIIGTYNRCKYVLATLASLRQQTLPHHLFEIIVVDNGSNDGTVEAIKAYILAHKQAVYQEEDCHIRYVQETQYGLACVRNTGVCYANGKVVVFLDDDTLVDKTFLERLLATYNETGADVVGGSVDILWEAPRPYWLFNELLEMLGYFQPFTTRTQIAAPLNLSKLNFSIKRLLLLELGGFVPFLLQYPKTDRDHKENPTSFYTRPDVNDVHRIPSETSSSSVREKHLHMPASIEVPYLCQELQRKGYPIWYDPTIRILHRISQPQLVRAFFIDCAYWNGRADVMVSYLERLDLASKAAATPQRHVSAASSSQTSQSQRIQDQKPLRDTSTGYQTDWREFLQLALLHRPLLSLARKSARERLMVAITQSYLWGRIQQKFSLANHAPSTIAYPDILLLRANKQDGLQLQQGFQAIRLYSIATIACLPLFWLWRHRRHKGNIVGIIHCYRPGAFQLNHWQRQQLTIRLWLAQRMGIPLVTTDAGGWWQHANTLAARQYQAFEQYIFHNSHLILSYSRHTAQLYPDPQLRRRVHSLSHPGLHGSIPYLIAHKQAIHQLNIRIPTQQRSFMYLCFAQHHSTREVLSLINAFVEVQTIVASKTEKDAAVLHLIIVGKPYDSDTAEKIVQYATNNKCIHISLKQALEDTAVYLSASDALVLPYLLYRAAGTLDMACLWYSYEKIVIIPDLPRFQDVFPSHACLIYDPGSHTSLVEALQRAIYYSYRHSPEERSKLAGNKAWKQHAQRIQTLHKLLLQH